MAFSKRPSQTGDGEGNCLCDRHCTVLSFGKDCCCPAVLGCTRKQRLECLGNHHESCREEQCGVCDQWRQVHETSRDSAPSSSGACPLCSSRSGAGELFSSETQPQNGNAAANVTATTSQPSTATPAPLASSGTESAIVTVGAAAMCLSALSVSDVTTADPSVPKSPETGSPEETQESSFASPRWRRHVCDSDCFVPCSGGLAGMEEPGDVEPAADATVEASQSAARTSTPPIEDETDRATELLAALAAIGNLELLTEPFSAATDTSPDVVGESPGTAQTDQTRPLVRAVVTYAHPARRGTVGLVDTSASLSKEWQQTVELDYRCYMIYRIVTGRTETPLDPNDPLNSGWKDEMGHIIAAANSEVDARGAYRSYLSYAKEAEVFAFQNADNQDEYHDCMTIAALTVEENKERNMRIIGANRPQQ